MNNGRKGCGNKTCPVCKLYQRIVAEGAEPQQGSVIRERNCRCDIRFDNKCKCFCRIRLDVATASYRRKPDSGSMTKMCDFAVAAVKEQRLYLIVLEIKDGVAHRGALEQLQAGLSLLHRTISSNETVCPSAYIVARKQTSQLKRILRQTRLKFGSNSFRPRVIRCGTTLSIPQGR